MKYEVIRVMWVAWRAYFTGIIEGNADNKECK